MKLPVLISAVLLWSASLAAAFFFGRHRGESVARAEYITRTANSEEGGGRAKPPPPGVARVAGASAEAGADGTAAAGRPTLKQILAQVKAIMRSGGMNNPATGIKALTLLSQIRDEDLSEALKAAEETKEPQGKMMLYMVLLSRWAEKDGPAAMKYADENLANAGPMVQMARMGIVSSWAQSDPEAVWKWYKTEVEKDGPGGAFGGKSMALMGMFSSMSSKDLDGALKRARELESNEERRMAMMGIFQTAVDDEARGKLMKEIDSLQDADERRESRSALMSQWVMMEPDSAVSYIESLEGDERHAAAKSAGNMLMMTDPKRGAEFLLKNGNEQDKAATYEQIVSSWANQDANAAGAWLGEQPQGDHLDRARASFAGVAAKRDPESAMEWAKTVSDVPKRERAVEQVYTAWRKKDQASADQALQGAGLSAEKVEQIAKKAAGKVDEQPAPPAVQAR